MSWLIFGIFALWFALALLFACGAVVIGVIVELLAWTVAIIVVVVVSAVILSLLFTSCYGVWRGTVDVWRKQWKRAGAQAAIACGVCLAIFIPSWNWFTEHLDSEYVSGEQMTVILSGCLFFSLYGGLPYLCVKRGHKHKIRSAGPRDRDVWSRDWGPES